MIGQRQRGQLPTFDPALHCALRATYACSNLCRRQFFHMTHLLSVLNDRANDTGDSNDNSTSAWAFTALMDVVASILEEDSVQISCRMCGVFPGGVYWEGEEELRVYSLGGVCALFAIR